MRVGFIKLTEGKQVLMVDVHHIVADGSSLEILVKEFSLLHHGEELPPLRLRYKDFVAWQNSESREEVLRRQEEYWLEVFKEDVPVLNLPADYPEPQKKNFKGSFIRFEIAREETEKLKELAKQIEATLYIVMLSVFNIFLSRLSGQEDIVLGTPLEGRNHADLYSIIGMFVNTLALRNYPQAEKTFSGFLKEIKERTVRAFENQDYQFEDLVERLKIKREPNRNPLFDILFSFQTPEEQAGDGEPVDYGFKIAQFDLILTGVEKRETIKRFAREYPGK
jgi:iturin family lipopeptide synthetase B